MRVGIELRQIALGGTGGMAMLLRGVLRSMFERHPQHQFVCFNTIFNRGLFGQVPANVELNTLALGGYFEQIGRLCTEKKVDVLFRGYPMEDHVDFPLHRQVVAIPDIQHEYFPDFFDAQCLRLRRTAFSQVLGGAGAVGTISEFARQTLLEQPCTRCRDIFLMCPALQVEHQQHDALTAAEVAQIPEGDYFLYPANLWKHKNHERVLQAFERFRAATQAPVQFLFTGHPAGWEKCQKQFGHLPIRHLGFVRPALLRKLLEGARALVFFSLYEGFGIPLLEAFDAGTPVLCSNTTSLPEVGRDAILTCDPTDVEAMCALMARITTDSNLRHDLVRRGKQRLKAYSWEEAADNLMAACERVGQRAEDAAQPQLTRIDVTEWPRVAIVTPSYNQGQFLQRTIESVLTQNYPHIDYIVMDGASTDDSLDILRSFGNRLRWVSERDNGQTHAINKGFARTTGDIRAYLNSDDTLLPGAVQSAVNHFLAHPDCDLAYGKAHLTDEDDFIHDDYRTTDYSFERLVADCFISQPAAFWRTTIAERVGPFDESLHYSMDYDYWMRIDRAGGGIEYLRDFLACSRVHGATKTLTQRTRVFRECIRVCMRHAGFAPLSYYDGLWHFRCNHESLGRLLWRRMPYLPLVLARLHHRWDNHATYSNREFLRSAARALKKRLPKPLLRLLSKPPARISQSVVVNDATPQPPAPPSPKIVDGVWSDNWVGATCAVRLKANPLGDHIQLTGIPTEPMELTIAVKGKQIGVFPLRGQHLEEIEFQVEPGQERAVVLQFSKHTVDAAGRKLSFMLQGTNLFSEQDLAA